MLERSGAGSIPMTNGSGSRRPKNTWIRIWIRIRNTACLIYSFLSEHASPPLCNDWHSSPSAVLEQDITPPPHTHSAVQSCTVQLHGLIPHALPCLCDGTYAHCAYSIVKAAFPRHEYITIDPSRFPDSWSAWFVWSRSVRTRYFWSVSDPNHFSFVGSFYIKSSSSLAGSRLSNFYDELV
jgi:hypothetical protein